MSTIDRESAINLAIVKSKTRIKTDGLDGRALIDADETNAEIAQDVCDILSSMSESTIPLVVELARLTLSTDDADGADLSIIDDINNEIAWDAVDFMRRLDAVTPEKVREAIARAQEMTRDARSEFGDVIRLDDVDGGAS